MSNTVNTELFEAAAELIDYFEGTIIARALEADLETNDLEQLAQHVNEARHEQFLLEYNPGAV